MDFVVLPIIISESSPAYELYLCLFSLLGCLMACILIIIFVIKNHHTPIKYRHDQSLFSKYSPDACNPWDPRCFKNKNGLGNNPWDPGREKYSKMNCGKIKRV